MSIKDRIFDQEGRTFPGRTYSEVILAPIYDKAKEVLLEPMVAIHKAHLIMLVEKNLLTKKEAASIMEGIWSLDIPAIKDSAFDGQYEDLFFYIERKITETAGEEGGSLHLARSRNDMDVAMYRMVLRGKVQAALRTLISFQETLLEVMDAYKETICLGYTHTQQAQPMTFSHYLSGYYDVVVRDMKRLIAAYETCNESPLGAAALTTTGFPINRWRVADLLGFRRIVKSAYDSISGADYLGELASALQIAFINLGRFTQELLLWCTQEFDAIRIADPYVQTSSIMPQKRNPVSLEHIRALSSSGIGNALTVLQMLHNTPYVDTNDAGDDLQPYLWTGLDLLDQVFRLSRVVIGTLEVNEEILKKRAEESFASITELADTLFRETRLSFRTSHSITSQVVKLALSRGLTAKEVDAKLVDEASEKVVGRALQLPEEVIRMALDPEHFIKVRSLPGGPAPIEMSRGIKERKERLAKHKHWLETEIHHIAECMGRLDELTEKWRKSKE